MRHPRKTEAQKFKELQAKWYKKLANNHKHPDGAFKDIEKDEWRLHSYSTVLMNYGNETTWSAKRDYYQMAENFLNDYPFKTRLEEIIWAYHAHGISGQNIAMLLTKAKVKKTNRTDVLNIVKRLRGSMYAMYLTPHGEQSE